MKGRVNDSLDERHAVLISFFTQPALNFRVLFFVFRVYYSRGKFRSDHGPAVGVHFQALPVKSVMHLCRNVTLLSLGGSFFVGFARVAETWGPGSVYMPFINM